MSQKLTPWYPGHIKPARPGVYQTDSSSAKFILGCQPYQKWSGKHWGLACANPFLAEKHSFFYSGPSFRWRGLAEKP